MKRTLSLLIVLLLGILPVFCSVSFADEAVTVELSHEWASFDMGETHSAAIQPEGLGYAWGFNYDGPIGNGSTSSSNCPVPYNWGENVAAVSANRKTTAFIDENGVLYLIGEIWFGTGGSSDMPTPYVYTSPYQLATNVRSVSMGENHLVFVKNDNTLWVYGENDHGQLGSGNTTNSYTPTQRMTGVAYAVAADNLTVVLKTDGSVVTSGYNAYGQVGNNSTTDQTTFTQAHTDVFTISAFGDHVMAIKNNGSLWAWGRNDYGQLGNGNTTNQRKAVQVMTGAAQVSAGMYHTGVIKTDGSLWFAGNNWRGCFGTGSTGGYSEAHSTFTRTAGTYLAVNCGLHSTAVVNPNGQLSVAGANGYGQLGTGATCASVPTLTPIDVWIFRLDEPPAALLGDTNCDGVVDFSDAALLAAYLSGRGQISEQGLINANANQDSIVSIADITAIYSIIFG